MSDFIFSSTNIDQNIITKRIKSIYDQDVPHVQEFHGKWGSIGVSKNLYNGFKPYENKNHIAIVIGGPVLMFRDNSFLTDENDSFAGTKAIYERWLLGKINWDKDLSGPFVVLFINKRTCEIECVTDLMSFIPVYSYNDQTQIVLGTHIDAIAMLTGQNNNIDEVSTVDFILHGIVTYPYTIYKNVFQIAPASEHRKNLGSTELNEQNYWLPTDDNMYVSIDDASEKLRKGLEKYIGKILRETSNISQFISGGEDSRTISGILANTQRDAYVFLDNMNREGRIAKKVANIYGAELKVFTRSKLHYLNILPSCAKLVGSGSQYIHAHTYGFHKICKLDSYTAVFGGLLSDAMLKGSHIKKVRYSGQLPFIPQMKDKSYSANIALKSDVFTAESLFKLSKRRQAHLKYVETLRSESAEEWFELWPSSMNNNIPNIHANRRLFRSYEPFMAAEVVTISSKIPQKWKLNRKLFHRIGKPYLKPSKWLLHGNGWLPYYPWYVNNSLRFIFSVYRKIMKKVGKTKEHQGPWTEKGKLIQTKEWEDTVKNLTKGFEIPFATKDQPITQMVKQGDLTINQYINLTQILYELEDRS